MKRFLMILAAVMFVAVGCDNSKEQYDPDKNKPEVDNNGDNGNGGNGNAIQTGSTVAVFAFLAVILMAAGLVMFSRKRSNG